MTDFTPDPQQQQPFDPGAMPQFPGPSQQPAPYGQQQPGPYSYQPVARAVPKNAVLYCVLGLLIPGLPSLLIRDDKVIGGIQLGIWIVSWFLALFIIGFLIWPAVAIWSAITGYQDAQVWNRLHGFVT